MYIISIFILYDQNGENYGFFYFFNRIHSFEKNYISILNEIILIIFQKLYRSHYNTLSLIRINCCESSSKKKKLVYFICQYLGYYGFKNGVQLQKVNKCSYSNKLITASDSSSRNRNT